MSTLIEGRDSSRSLVLRSGSDGKLVPALTGVRAIAAYLVFLHHFTPAAETVGSVLRGMLTEAHIGVTMFFVLSGFLITYRYDGKLTLTAPDLKRYFWNRFARIYPLYLVLLIPTLILAQEHRFGRWLVEVTLFKGFFNDYRFNGIPQAWSLTVEECFYASAPLLLIGLRSRYRAWALPGIYVLGAILLSVGAQVRYHGLFGNLSFMCGYTLFGRCLEFLLGAWMAMNLQRLEVFKSVPHKTYMGLAGMAASLVIFDGLKAGGAFYLGVLSPAGVLLNNLILPFWIGLFYLGLLQDDSYLKRVLSTSLLQLLGKASYAFYLIHLGFIATYLASRNITGVWFFLALNVIAIALFKLVEEPINHWLRSRGPGKREMATHTQPRGQASVKIRVRRAA
jgi:peptidoglycan/LPS O-acetylase OafA/YrhL